MQSNMGDVTAEEIKHLKSLLKRYNSRYIGERTEVIQEIDAMGERFTDILIAFLQRETSKYYRRKRLAKGILVTGFSTMVFLTIWVILTKHYMVFTGYGAFGSLAGVTGLLAPSQSYLSAVNILAQREDKRLVGFLAEALATNRMAGYPNALKIAMAEVLIRVLPQLTRADGSYLNPQQRNALYSLLKSGERNKETALLVAIMDGLTHLEDVGAIPALEALQKRPANTPNELAIREKAQLSLTPLYLCRERLETAQTLLRPSSQHVFTNELLRPAMDVKQEQENLQLLRASSKEGE